MNYNTLKILHIICATALLTSVGYSYHLWRRMQQKDAKAVGRIQTQTGFIIIPLAIIQLATGFTMISLQHYDFSEIWISGSVIGFILAMGSWFSFIYFLLVSQQVSASSFDDSASSSGKHKAYRSIQSKMLLVCIATLTTMVFFMANKVATLHG